jgi:uncharacterized membrane protein YhhN
MSTTTLSILCLVPIFITFLISILLLRKPTDHPIRQIIRANVFMLAVIAAYAYFDKTSAVTLSVAFVISWSWIGLLELNHLYGDGPELDKGTCVYSLCVVQVVMVVAALVYWN